MSHSTPHPSWMSPVDRTDPRALAPGRALPAYTGPLRYLKYPLCQQLQTDHRNINRIHTILRSQLQNIGYRNGFCKGRGWYIAAG